MSSFVLPAQSQQLQPSTTLMTDDSPMDTSPSTFENNNPVTQAVLDNILGKLPTKKPLVVITCNICKLEFSGQIVMDMHLAGARHAKKVKSLEILSHLQIMGETFTRDDKTKILKCEICNIVVNSSQQLQTHLSGNKHKQKVTKLSAQGIATAVKQPVTTNGKGSSNIRLPPGVQVLPDAAGAKAKKYYCDTCNVPLNSEVQLEQHLTSRKHKDRLNPKPKRPTLYFWKSQPAFFPGVRGRGMKRPFLSSQYQKPLSSNFVTGGNKGNYSSDYMLDFPEQYSPNYDDANYYSLVQY